MGSSFERETATVRLLGIGILGLAILMGPKSSTSLAYVQGSEVEARVKEDLAAGERSSTDATPRDASVTDIQATQKPGACSLTAVRHAGSYPTGLLKGRAAGDLYGAFLGLSGRFPTTLKVDWDNTIDKLWSRKIEERNSNAVARSVGSVLVTEYHTCDSGRMSLIEYQRQAAVVAKVMYDKIDWDALSKSRFRGKDQQMNARRARLLKRISENFGGRSLVAYAGTELLPSHRNGAYNRDYLDFVLRYGGRRYLESLPALHDSITSFGPFQFTQFALYDANGERRGASNVNRFLPASLRIPGSTMHLRGDDHIKAAYLFGVHNLAHLIGKLNARQLGTLERVASSRAVDVLQYIATAHNKPAVALNCGRRWLDNGARLSFHISCPTASRIYAIKTKSNYEALSPTAGT